MSNWNAGEAVNWEEGPATAGAGDWDDNPSNNAQDSHQTFNDSNTGNGDNNEAGPSEANTCRNCGSTSHFARECPEPRKMTGECYRCGQVGHNKADCTNEPVERAFTGECFRCGQVGHSKADCTNEPIERPFTGTCRLCSEEGHRAADCPQKPAEQCRVCGAVDHKASECQANRKLDRTNIADMEKEAAWELVKEHAAQKDMAGVRIALDSYIKADEAVTYVDLEKRFRAENVPVYCIGQELDVPRTLLLVNLQGKAGCKYTANFFFSPNPRRQIFTAGWPESPEDNMERLADAGITMQNFNPLCRNCDEMGHLSKDCPQGKIEKINTDVVKCNNCGQEGHRQRDCKEERQTRGGKSMGCRRCGEVGHMAKDCPNEDSRPTTCRNCGEEGHMSRECEKPKNPDNATCRNCDQVGHFSRDCPEPKDWTRVKCTNCQQMGHGAKRCTEPITDGIGDAGIGEGDGFEATNASFDGDNNKEPDAGENSWEGGATESHAW